MAEIWSGEFSVNNFLDRITIDTVGKEELHRIINPLRRYVYANGVGHNRINQGYYRKHTLTAAEELWLDVFNGLTDDDGTSRPFTSVKVFSVVNTSTTPGDTVSVMPASSSPWSSWASGVDGGVKVRGAASSTDTPGIMFLGCSDSSGYDVSNDGAQLILRNDSASSIDVYLLLAGEKP